MEFQSLSVETVIKEIDKLSTVDSKCSNMAALFINEETSHPMEFHISASKEKEESKILEKLETLVKMCGGVLKFRSEGNMKSIHLCRKGEIIFDKGDDIFHWSYLLDCVKENHLLNLNKYRVGKMHFTSDVDVMDILNGYNTWADAKRLDSDADEISDIEDEESAQILKNPSKQKHWFTHDDDLKILQNIIQHGAYSLVKSKSLWCSMEKTEVCGKRSWQSMRERYLKYIIPKLDTYPLSVSKRSLITIGVENKSSRLRRKVHSCRGDEESDSDQSMNGIYHSDKENKETADDTRRENDEANVRDNRVENNVTENYDESNIKGREDNMGITESDDESNTNERENIVPENAEMGDNEQINLYENQDNKILIRGENSIVKSIDFCDIKEDFDSTENFMAADMDGVYIMNGAKGIEVRSYTEKYCEKAEEISCHDNHEILITFPPVPDGYSVRSTSQSIDSMVDMVSVYETADESALPVNSDAETVMLETTSRDRDSSWHAGTSRNAGENSDSTSTEPFLSPRKVSTLSSESSESDVEVVDENVAPNLRRSRRNMAKERQVTRPSSGNPSFSGKDEYKLTTDSSSNESIKRLRKAEHRSNTLDEGSTHHLTFHGKFGCRKKLIGLGKRDKFSITEDKNIILYIYKYGEITNIKGRRVWVDMRARGVCRGRTWQALKERFLKRILPYITAYENEGISPEIIERFNRENYEKNKAETPNVSKTKSGDFPPRFYSEQEKYNIVNFIIKNRRYSQIKGNKLFKTMAVRMPNPEKRTWQSLKNTFSKYIITEIKHYVKSKEVAQMFTDAWNWKKFRKGKMEVTSEESSDEEEIEEVPTASSSSKFPVTRNTAKKFPSFTSENIQNYYILRKRKLPVVSPTPANEVVEEKDTSSPKKTRNLAKKALFIEDEMFEATPVGGRSEKSIFKRENNKKSKSKEGVKSSPATIKKVSEKSALEPKIASEKQESTLEPKIILEKIQTTVTLSLEQESLPDNKKLNSPHRRNSPRYSESIDIFETPLKEELLVRRSPRSLQGNRPSFKDSTRKSITTLPRNKLRVRKLTKYSISTDESSL